MYAKQKAMNLLRNQNITGFETDILSLKHDITIYIDSFLSYGDLTGYPCAFNTDSYLLKHVSDKVTYVILYNDFLPRVRRRWNIAHELGHVYLGHEDDGRRNEVQAHAFASHLLMPDIVVKEVIKLGYRDYISDIFGVSREAASKKLKYMNNMQPLTIADEYLLRKYDNLLNELGGCRGKNNSDSRVHCR